MKDLAMDEGRSLLAGSRVYLSGPMDFVASRAEERERGWRAQISSYLSQLGCIVFDPWNKPNVRSIQGYGIEDETTVHARESWTFRDDESGASARADCAKGFWETVHIDLRMVDVSDFVIAYVPTNIYSVGTPHEIILARQQHKPVLFVSPRVNFPSLDPLRQHLKDDPTGLALLDKLTTEVPIKPNERHIPSLWYMPLVGLEHFFDGFGFSLPEYREHFPDAIQEPENPERPLLRYLSSLAAGIAPKRWNPNAGVWEADDDWLILDACLHEKDKEL